MDTHAPAPAPAPAAAPPPPDTLTPTAGAASAGDVADRATGADRAPAFPFDRYRRLRFGDRRPRCPHCGAARVHRWGGFRGRRRYRCVACSRTFSDFTGTPLAYLKHIDRWPAFGPCMRHGLSVRETGRRLGVDKDTAFRWRHRLLAALLAADSAPLGSTLAFGETWFAHSEKGSRRLDRPPRRRAAFRREAMTPVWVFVARDERGRTATGVVGPDRPRPSDLEAALEGRLHRPVTLVCGAGPYGAVGTLAARLAVPYRRPASHSPELAAVRDYTHALRRWIRRFRGVATRYLDHYLAWHRCLASQQFPGTEPGAGREGATDSGTAGTP